MARILLAEDDPVLGQLQQSILEAHQHEVVIAEDGEQAQRALVEGGFDILVTDAQMPKITGVELIRWLRSQGSRSHLPALLTSGYDADEEVTALLDLQTRFLCKPLTMDDLVRTIHALLADE